MDDTDPLVTVMKVEKAPQETYADIGGLDNQIQEIKVYHFSLPCKKTEPELFFLKSMFMLMMFNAEWTQTAYNQLSGCSLNAGPNHANNQQLKWYRFCLLLVLRLTIHWGWLCSLFLCYTGVSGVASHTSRVLWRDGHQAPQRCHLIRTTWHR